MRDQTRGKTLRKIPILFWVAPSLFREDRRAKLTGHLVSLARSKDSPGEAVARRPTKLPPSKGDRDPSRI